MRVPQVDHRAGSAQGIPSPEDGRAAGQVMYRSSRWLATCRCRCLLLRARRLAGVPVTAAMTLAFAVLGLAVGGAGVRNLIRDQRDARQSLARLVDPIDENPVLAAFRRRDVGLAHHQLEVDGRELRRLLATRADQRQSVLLVVAGLALSFTGTLLTLPW